MRASGRITVELVVEAAELADRDALHLAFDNALDAVLRAMGAASISRGDAARVGERAVMVGEVPIASRTAPLRPPAAVPEVAVEVAPGDPFRGHRLSTLQAAALSALRSLDRACSVSEMMAILRVRYPGVYDKTSSATLASSLLRLVKELAVAEIAPPFVVRGGPRTRTWAWAPTSREEG